MSSPIYLGPKNLDTFWCTGWTWNCQIIFRFASIHGLACFILYIGRYFLPIAYVIWTTCFRAESNLNQSNGVHLSHSRQVAHVYYQLFDSKMAHGDQLWSVPKLEYDLLRRNASTNVRKTDLIERYRLHRKPKHSIYVRYFSILLYLLNVQVAACPVWK
jgi:hypothetical protein